MMCPLNANEALRPTSLYQEGILQKKNCQTQMTCPLKANDVILLLPSLRRNFAKKNPNANDVSFKRK